MKKSDSNPLKSFGFDDNYIVGESQTNLNQRDDHRSHTNGTDDPFEVHFGQKTFKESILNIEIS